jgi:hypothetical protein
VKRALCFLGCLLFPALACAQGRDDEIVANLAAGRVIIYVADEGMVIGTIEQPMEVGSLPPRFVNVGGTHIGVLLGAAEWILPGADSKPVRVDRNLQHVTGDQGRENRSNPEAASDIEAIGINFLEHLRPFVNRLHHKLALGPDEPILEIVVAGYAGEYGPEVWLLKYRVKQDYLRGDYVQTRVLRPSYAQLYPPEKKAPRTLVEVRYPEEDDSGKSAAGAGPYLLELLQNHDPRFVRLRSSDPKTARAIEQIERGKSQASPLADAGDFLHAALVILAGGKRIALGTMAAQRGFDWIVPPAERLEKEEGPNARPSLRHLP